MKSTKARVFRATGDGREIQRDGTDVCRVVKAGNTRLAAVLASNPRQAGGNRVLFCVWRRRRGEDGHEQAARGPWLRDGGPRDSRRRGASAAISRWIAAHAEPHQAALTCRCTETCVLLSDRCATAQRWRFAKQLPKTGAEVPQVLEALIRRGLADAQRTGGRAQQPAPDEIQTHAAKVFGRLRPGDEPETALQAAATHAQARRATRHWVDRLRSWRQGGGTRPRCSSQTYWPTMAAPSRRHASSPAETRTRRAARRHRRRTPHRRGR